VEARIFVRQRAAFGAADDCPIIVGKDWTAGYALALACGFDTIDSFINGVNLFGPGEAVPVGQWLTLALTWTGSVRQLYIDGVQVAVDAVPGPLNQNTFPLRIGNDVSWDASLDGRIDEVAVWSVARTAAQLAASAQAPLTGGEPGLVALWHLDGDATDAAGGHNGAVIGDAAFVVPTASPTPSPTPTPSPSPTPQPPLPPRADIDCDGQDTAKDALLLLRGIAGLEAPLPSGCTPVGEVPPATPSAAPTETPAAS